MEREGGREEKRRGGDKVEAEAELRRGGGGGLGADGEAAFGPQELTDGPRGK